MVTLTNSQELVKADMVKFFNDYREALPAIEAQVQQYREQLAAQWELGMTHHITRAVDAGIPKRQIGLAYGYKSPISGSTLVDKYYNPLVPTGTPAPTVPTGTVAPGAAPTGTSQSEVIQSEVIQNESDLPPELQTLGKIEVTSERARTVNAPPDAYLIDWESNEKRYVWQVSLNRWLFDQPPADLAPALEAYLLANLPPQ